MGGFANNAPIVTDGLVFYVDAGNSKSYDGVSGGTTWTDLVGGNDGTLTNMDTNSASGSYVYDSGNAGSIAFDGADDYVSIANDLFSGNNEGTLEVILSTDDITSDKKFFTQEHPTDASGGSSFCFTCETGGVRHRHFNGNRTYGVGQISTGSIHHISVVIPSSATQTDDLLVYIDTQNYSGTQTAGSVQTLNIGSGRIEIGAETRNNSYFDGKIYCVKVYNRALSVSEITQNYNALKNRFV
tara:strand:- start:33 stop:758 length:726 start_codon:yes stop_codon:yes gene_type:complete